MTQARAPKAQAVAPEASPPAELDSAPSTPETPKTAAELGQEAIATLTRIMREATSDTARIAACNALLDRAYGKAGARAGGAGASAGAAEGPVETRLTVRFV